MTKQPQRSFWGNNRKKQIKTSNDIPKSTSFEDSSSESRPERLFEHSPSTGSRFTKFQSMLDAPNSDLGDYFIVCLRDLLFNFSI